MPEDTVVGVVESTKKENSPTALLAGYVGDCGDDTLDGRVGQIYSSFPLFDVRRGHG